MADRELTVPELLAEVAKSFPEEVPQLNHLLTGGVEMQRVVVHILAIGFLTGRRFGFEEAQANAALPSTDTPREPGGAPPAPRSEDAG